MSRVVLYLSMMTSLVSFACDKPGESPVSEQQPTQAPSALPEPAPPPAPAAEVEPEPAALMTAELRDSMTPDEVLQAFKDGHKRFMTGQLRYRKLVTEVKEGAIGQTPYAVVLSCIDSRVPAETIFDKRLGDIFNTRLAGNVVNEDVLGGMEFATKFAGAKLVVVMGHTKCGAVQGAAAKAEHGNLTALVSKIQPSVTSAQAKWDKPADPKDYDYVDLIAADHVRHSIAEIRENSPSLKSLEDEGAIRIVGAMYDVSNGQVTWLD